MNDFEEIMALSRKIVSLGRLLVGNAFKFFSDNSLGYGVFVGKFLKEIRSARLSDVVIVYVDNACGWCFLDSNLSTFFLASHDAVKFNMQLLATTRTRNLQRAVLKTGSGTTKTTSTCLGANN
jgi:hypothetical protein